MWFLDAAVETIPPKMKFQAVAHATEKRVAALPLSGTIGSLKTEYDR
jgi:hypothetical protein